MSGTIKDEEYFVVYRRKNVLNGVQTESQWVTNTVTAPADRWWFPSQAGEELPLPTWQLGNCSTSTDGEHLVKLEDFHVLPAPKRAGGTAGAGGPAGGTGCSSCSTDKTGMPLYGASFGLSLGAASDGTTVSLSFQSDLPSEVLSQPSSLVISHQSENKGVTIVPDASGNIAQVAAPLSFTTVSINSQYSYSIKVYKATAKGAWNSTTERFDLLNGAANLVATWTIRDPDGAAPFNELELERSVGGSTQIWRFSYATVSDGGAWKLTFPDSLGYRVVTRTTSGNSRTDKSQVYEANNTLVSERVQVHETKSWGLALMSDTLGAGVDAQTTQYSYHNDPNRELVSQVVRPDGSWDRFYTYDTKGRPTIQRSGIDTGVSDTDSLVRKVVFDYAQQGSAGDGSTDNGLVGSFTPRKEVVSYKGVNISSLFRVITLTERREVRCSKYIATYAAAILDPETLITVTTYDPVTARALRTRHADGTLTTYSMSVASEKTTDTVRTGAPGTDPNVVAKGTKTETVTGIYNQLCSVTVTDIESSVILSRQLTPDDQFDEFSRPKRIEYLDGTYEEFSYDCCGLAYVVDREGVTTDYFHDGLNRVTYTQRNNVHSGQDYDSAGRITERWREAAGQPSSRIALALYEYDTAGRLERERNGYEDGWTSYTESTEIPVGSTDERRVLTTINPDGGTRVERFYQDGKLELVTGTAVFPVRYEYGVDNGYEYTKEIRLATGTYADTTEWTKTVTDGLSRAFKTVYADNAYHQSFYNSKGQLWKERDPDDVIMMFAYNGRGEREYTVAALSDATRLLTYDQLSTALANKTMPSTLDRITRVVRTVVAGPPGSINAETMVWKGGASDGVTVEKTEVSPDGKQFSRTLWETIGEAGATNISQTVFDRPNRKRTVTVTNPDNTQTVTAYQDGRLSSVTRKDNTDSLVTETTYLYDAHGRADRVTDRRTGTTTYTFNNADQVRTVTTPDPGTGQQVTTTDYDNMGRVISVLHPDNKTTTTRYYQNGLVQRVFGARTYPVEYAYDYAGRISTMTTFSTFSAATETGTEPRTTRWNYHSKRGWLASKDYPGPSSGDPPAVEDAGIAGPKYEYTSGGRLKKRIWLRTNTSGLRVATVYTYGFESGAQKHSDLVEIAYENSPVTTPGVTYTYDRLGRLWTATRNGMTTTLG